MNFDSERTPEKIQRQVIRFVFIHGKDSFVEKKLNNGKTTKNWVNRRTFNDTEKEVLLGFYPKKTYSEMAEVVRGIRKRITKNTDSNGNRETSEDIRKRKEYLRRVGAFISKSITVAADSTGLLPDGKEITKDNYPGWVDDYWDKIVEANKQGSSDPVVIRTGLATATTEQSAIFAERAIALLSGRLKADSKKVELYDSIVEFQDIANFLKNKYNLRVEVPPHQIEPRNTSLELIGLLPDLERFQESFRAEKLRDLLGIPIKKIQILSESLDDSKIQEIFDNKIEERQLAGVNLSQKDLSCIFLFRAILTSAKLSETNLFRANLQFANLCKADLYKADLYKADLYKADLSQADLRRASFFETNLTNVCIDGIKLSERVHKLLKILNREAESESSQRFTTDISGAIFIDSDLTDSIFINVNAKNVTFKRTILKGAIFMFANLEDTDLSQVSNVKFARFIAVKGLSKNTRRALKRQGAIFVETIAMQIASQAVGATWNLVVRAIALTVFIASEVVLAMWRLAKWLGRQVFRAISWIESIDDLPYTATVFSLAIITVLAIFFVNHLQGGTPLQPTVPVRPPNSGWKVPMRPMIP